MATLTLIHGDCLEKMKDISSGSIDLIICDLPYGCLANKRSGRRVGNCEEGKPNSNIVIESNGCDWDVPIDLEAFWTEVKRIRRSDHSPTIHFCTTKFGNDLIQSNPNEFRHDLVWSKGRGVSFLSANKMPMRSHEMIYVFSKKGAYYKRVDISGNFANTNVGSRPKNYSTYQTFANTEKESNEGKRCVLSVVDIANSLKKDNHPTEKPIALYKWLIERYCPPGGTVLDPTFGSGNSVFTAHKMGRNAIGIEKDKTFYDKAVTL